MFKKLLLASLLLFSTSVLSEEATFDAAPVKGDYPTGLKIPKNWQEKANFKSAKPTLLGLPRHWDWREQGKLSAIEDQGNCGSCYTFSTAAALQDALSLKGIADPDLSEQNLLSCNQEGYGCDGGFFLHDMHVSPGAVQGKDFPYQAKKVACKQNLAHPYQLTSWAYIPTNSKDGVPTVDEIKAAIFQYGTISAGVAVTQDFMNYKSGIFNKCTTATQPNHAINIVGWDDDGQYWIMRNSWGSRFGENGYMRIKWNCNFIGLSSNYVVVNSKPVDKCTPLPEANIGQDISIRRGMGVVLGKPGKPGTTYRWESSIKPDPFERNAQITVRPWSTRSYTVYATTKCGTAKASIIVYVRWR